VLNRLRNPERIARSDPDQEPRALGDIVQANNGGPWGMLVDRDGSLCTVGYRRNGEVCEVELPCGVLHLVPR
jgi:hypothetical protein